MAQLCAHFLGCISIAHMQAGRADRSMMACMQLQLRFTHAAWPRRTDVTFEDPSADQLLLQKACPAKTLYACGKV